MSVPRDVPHRRLSWLALVCLGMLATGSNVRAGCGDHVTSATRFQGSDLFASGVTDPTGLLFAEDTPPDDDPQPCTGPSCSRRSGSPVTVTPTAPSTSDRTLSFQVADACPGTSRRFAAMPHRIAYHSPARSLPERPPRP